MAKSYHIGSSAQEEVKSDHYSGFPGVQVYDLGAQGSGFRGAGFRSVRSKVQGWGFRYEGLGFISCLAGATLLRVWSPRSRV